MSSLLDKYEKKLQKLKSTEGMRRLVGKAKVAAEEGRYSSVSSSYDIGERITSDLALGDEYFKKGDLIKASLKIEDSYNTVKDKVLCINNKEERKKFNKYLNSIEKRAERYVGKIINNHNSEAYNHAQELIKIAKKCKSLKV